MTRLVVQVRWRPPLDPDASEEERDGQWADLAAPLFERAGALGGRMIGWGDQSITVDFSWDGLYDAIDFLVDAPLAPELSSGICHGEVDLVYDAGRLALATGAPIRQVTLLSTLARPGEVLVSPELIEASNGRVGSVGPAGKRPGRPDLPAMVLDPERPLRDSTSPEAGPFDVLPDNQGLEKPVTLPPASEHWRQLERLADAAEVVERESHSLFPGGLAQALIRKDGKSLEELARSVGAVPAPHVQERLDAMSQLAQGHGGDAIRRLRAAKQGVAEEDLSGRCRASLALAVALAGVGRTQEAIFETLEGLVRARQAADEHGQRACARFMAQIARFVGDKPSERAWDGLWSE